MQIFFLKRRFLLFEILLIVGLSFLSPLCASAQQKTISGTVIGDDKVPIPGASIVIKGTTIGTVTDYDGKFSLKMPVSSKTLIFSFVGLTSKEIEIGATTVFNVVLSESRVGIDEVVVVGYGTQKKESVVGAITQVNNTSLMRSGFFECYQCNYW